MLKNSLIQNINGEENILTDLIAQDLYNYILISIINFALEMQKTKLNISKKKLN